MSDVTCRTCRWAIYYREASLGGPATCRCLYPLPDSAFLDGTPRMRLDFKRNCTCWREREEEQDGDQD